MAYRRHGGDLTYARGRATGEVAGRFEPAEKGNGAGSGACELCIFFLYQMQIVSFINLGLILFILKKFGIKFVH